MGYKLLKEHYRIGHAVCVTDKGICIGSPYIHDLIIVGLDGTIIKADDGRVNEDLKRYMAEMKADPEKLREVVQSPDTFKASIPVYTYDGGNIMEEKCEKTGWPNVTHTGHMMYENTYSPDRRKAVKWAKANAKAGIELGQRRVSEIKADLARIEAFVKECEADLAKLEADYNKPNDTLCRPDNGRGAQNKS
jgi:hypothetical protein